jgi:RNA polymerase sigma-70 factor (ECF subfamily)
MDPEDVLQSVFRSFFVRQAEGQFNLGDWDDLWSLLVRITVRKCGRRVAAFCAERRDVRREVRPDVSDPAAWRGWEAMAQEPAPDEVVCLTDMVESLMRGLDPTQREILLLRLQGHTVPEISGKVGRTERTVHRVLSQVRERLKRLEAGLAS